MKKREETGELIEVRIGETTSYKYPFCETRGGSELHMWFSPLKDRVMKGFVILSQ